MDIIYDFAGDNVRRIRELEEGKLEIAVRLQDGVGLINWLVEFSNRIQVTEPERVRESVLGKLKEGVERYEKG